MPQAANLDDLFNEVTQGGPPPPAPARNLDDLFNTVTGRTPGASTVAEQVAAKAADAKAKEKAERKAVGKEARRQSEQERLSYLAQIARNAPGNALDVIEALPGMAITGLRAVDELGNMGRGYVREQFGLDPQVRPHPNLDAVAAFPRDTVEHFAGLLDPDERARRLRDEPVSLVLDLTAVEGVRPTAAMARRGATRAATATADAAAAKTAGARAAAADAAARAQAWAKTPAGETAVAVGRTALDLSGAGVPFRIVETWVKRYLKWREVWGKDAAAGKPTPPPPAPPRGPAPAAEAPAPAPAPNPVPEPVAPAPPAAAPVAATVAAEAVEQAPLPSGRVGPELAMPDAPVGDLSLSMQVLDEPPAAAPGPAAPTMQDIVNPAPPAPATATPGPAGPVPPSQAVPAHDPLTGEPLDAAEATARAQAQAATSVNTLDTPWTGRTLGQQSPAWLANDLGRAARRAGLLLTPEQLTEAGVRVRAQGLTPHEAVQAVATLDLPAAPTVRAKRRTSEEVRAADLAEELQKAKAAATVGADTLETPWAARTRGQQSPAWVQNDLWKAARKAGVALTKEQLDQAAAQVRAGTQTPRQAVEAFRPTPRPRATAAEVRAYAQLRAAGKTDAEAQAAIAAMRQMSPMSPAQVDADIAARVGNASPRRD